jgi:hypothetical protein
MLNDWSAPSVTDTVPAGEIDPFPLMDAEIVKLSVGDEGAKNEISLESALSSEPT